MAQRNRTNPGPGSGPPPKYPGTFLQAFAEGVAAANLKVQRWFGDGVVLTDAGGGEEQTVYLENLYRRCRQMDRSDWPALVAEFLRNIRPADHAELPSDLAACGDRLLPRLGVPFTKTGDVHPWTQALGGTGLCVNLVIDFPERMAYVNEDTVAQSEQSGADWLEKALANLQARTPADWLHTIDEETGVSMAQVGDCYDAARALLLDVLLPESAEFGCWVGPLGRDRLFVLPASISTMRHVHLLKGLAERNYRTTPYEEFVHVLQLVEPADEEDGEDGQGQD
jgi:hypothetical protein